MERDEIFMKKAVQAARKGLGMTSPNPAVGAVIVRDEKVISTGYHKKAGENHAEVEALGNMKEEVRPGDTMYVTLEPCNHTGRTPPCTQAILKSGIKRVVIGMSDPNPSVMGGGAQYLKKNGIEVLSGVCEDECRIIIEDYLKFVTTGRPFVIAKSALTLDGWTATSTGSSKWITCEKSRAYVHRMRSRVDAILAGIGTVLTDDPMLTVRSGRIKKNPLRIIVDTNLRMPHNARVMECDSGSKTLIIAGENSGSRIDEFSGMDNVKVIQCPLKGRRIDLGSLMDILGQMGITSLMVEGGAEILGSMIREKLIDKFYMFMAPKILGGNDGIAMAAGRGPSRMADAVNLSDIKIQRFDDDIMVRGYPDYKCSQV